MDRILEVLNWKPRGGLSLYGEPLVRLMRRLEECGGNLKKMMDGNPELAKTVAEVCVTRWKPSTKRTANVVLQPSWEHIRKPEQVAALLFHVGTLNPEWDKLAGPCARCGRYYLKKRASQKVYCSRRCGNAATAVARTRARIASERGDKLSRAKAAIKKWKSTATRQDWKHWVAQKTGIDPRFLTRAVTKGDLVPPAKRRKA